MHSLTGKSFRYTESEGKMSIAEILKKEGIREFSKDIRIMSTKELKANFSAVSSKEPKATLIIKNQIWQTYRRISIKREPATEGNLRSYWYSHIKPTLARVSLLSGYDHYETMLTCFVKMVRDYQLFRYADFGFDDDNWENRRIATKMPNVILFAEKAGWFRTLKECHDEYGMTIFALGGSPSLLSSEYLVKHLSEVTTLKQKFYLISAVDYDPAGFIIANAFVEQLKAQGILDFELVHIITLQSYTPEEIELFKFPIPSKQATKVAKWLKATGGIGGKAFGLEADSMPRSRFKELMRKVLDAFPKAKVNKSSQKK